MPVKLFLQINTNLTLPSTGTGLDDAYGFFLKGTPNLFFKRFECVIEFKIFFASMDFFEQGEILTQQKEIFELNFKKFSKS